jgi:hypothetical protein
MRIAQLVVRGAIVATLGVGGVVGLTGIAHAAGAGSISGQVTDSATHAPLGGIDVQVLAPRTNGGQTGPSFVAGATTAANGTYTVAGLDAATNYWVCFDGGLGTPVSTYTAQCYLNQPGFGFFPDPFGFEDVPSGSTTVSVGLGQQVTGIDAALVNTITVQPGTIAGKVTQTPLGNALSNVKVVVFDASGTVAGTATTVGNGTYEVDGLTSGQSYDVCFDGSHAKRGLTLNSYKSQCWKKAAWSGSGSPAANSTAVPVGSGQVVGGINAALAATI